MWYATKNTDEFVYVGPFETEAQAQKFRMTKMLCRSCRIYRKIPEWMFDIYYFLEKRSHRGGCRILSNILNKLPIFRHIQSRGICWAETGVEETEKPLHTEPLQPYMIEYDIPRQVVYTPEQYLDRKEGDK